MNGDLVWATVAAWAIGLASLLLPWFVGAGLGRFVRGWITDGARIRIALAVAGAPLVMGGWVPLSIYDQLIATLLLGAAFAVVGSPSPSARLSWTGVAVGGGILCIGALGVEELAEARLPRSTVRHPEAADLHFVFRAIDTDFSCRALDWKPRRGLVPPGTAPLRVLLGDSMVVAGDVGPKDRFSHLIAEARPEVRTLPLGFGGVGPDAYLFLVEKQVIDLHPEEVLLFVFLGNDTHDIDQDHPCCAEGRILGYEGGAAQVRCEPQAPALGLRRKLALGPAPFVLRLLAPSSVLAGRIASRWDAPEGDHKWRYTDWGPRGAQLDHTVLALRAIAERLAAARIRLRVVLLPPRWSLQQPAPDDPFPAVRARILSEARAAGIEVHDAWDLLQAAVDRDPKADWFQPHDANPHFGVAGHHLVADWLLREVIPGR